MGCGCKKNKTQEQTTQKPPSNIRLTEVQKPVVQQTTQTTQTQQSSQTTN